jgi:hypothetical protein
MASPHRADFRIVMVPCPPEQEHAYWAAMMAIYRMLAESTVKADACAIVESAVMT